MTDKFKVLLNVYKLTKELLVIYAAICESGAPLQMLRF